MGSELCGVDQQVKKAGQLVGEGEEDEVNQADRLNDIIIGLPSLSIAVNINNLPPEYKERQRLSELQQKILKMIQHQKKHTKPLAIQARPKKQNKLPDPYYIISMKAIYVGQWVFDKILEDNVPGGIGRLYTEDQIYQGELMTITEDKADYGNIDVTLTMIGGNREKIHFFGVDRVEGGKPQVTIDKSGVKKIDIILNGEGRILTRLTEYSGIFYKGRLQGKGYCRIKQGEDVYEYTGEFKQGRKNGKGTEKFQLNVYDGDFVDDKKTGKGMLTYLVSRAYERQRLKQQQQIKLAQNLKDPNQKRQKVKQFIGKKQKMQEQILKALSSKCKWKPPVQNYPPSIMENEIFVIQHLTKTKFLEHYKGEFKDDLFHGKGIYQWFNGKCYSGQWKEGKMDGFGQFYWPDGSHYIGQYSKDLKHGKGEMIWTKTKRYRGSWGYGKRHGYGQMIEIIYIEKDQREINAPKDMSFKPYLRVMGALWDKDIIKYSKDHPEHKKGRDEGMVYFDERIDLPFSEDEWQAYLKEQRDLITLVKEIH